MSTAGTIILIAAVFFIGMIAGGSLSDKAPEEPGVFLGAVGLVIVLIVAITRYMTLNV